MSWNTVLDCEDLPVLVLSNAFWPPEPLEGEIVGFFIRDPKTIDAIHNRDPRILDALAEMLDEIDEISTVMWFDGHWRRYNDDELEQKARLILQSEYASSWRKRHAKDALDYLEGKKRKKVEKEAKQYYSRKRRNQFAEERPDLMLALIERDGYQCRNCSDQNDLAIDHIIPLSKGGNDDLSNLQILCKSCNSSKGDRL